MCHRSVGLVQGAIERSGIPTVSLSLRPEITYGMNVSRAAYARFPMGNPFGEPHHPEQGRLVFGALLDLLENATEQQFIELPYRWKRWDKWL